MLTGGLLPFPRTGCVLYANAILSYCFEIRRVRPREGMGRLRRVARQRYCTFGRTWWTIAVAWPRLSTSIGRLQTMDDRLGIEWTDATWNPSPPRTAPRARRRTCL